MKLPLPSDATRAAWRRADEARAADAEAKARMEAAIIANAPTRNPFSREHRDLTAQGILHRLAPDLAEQLREAAR